jgi:hypothetical protein
MLFDHLGISRHQLAVALTHAMRYPCILCGEPPHHPSLFIPTEHGAHDLAVDDSTMFFYALCRLCASKDDWLDEVIHVVRSECESCAS